MNAIQLLLLLILGIVSIGFLYYYFQFFLRTDAQLKDQVADHFGIKMNYRFGLHWQPTDLSMKHFEGNPWILFAQIEIIRVMWLTLVAAGLFVFLAVASVVLSTTLK